MIDPPKPGFKLVRLPEKGVRATDTNLQSVPIDQDVEGAVTVLVHHKDGRMEYPQET